MQLTEKFINSLDAYWLTNAHVPQSLLPPIFQTSTQEGLCLVDFQIERGLIKRILVAGSLPISDQNKFDLAKKIVLPGFVDIHTHLDKGHIWQRSPNLDGTFNTALTTASQDSQQYWHQEDLLRRMDFSLRCAYAHGTTAIRTHLDSFGEQAEISFAVFNELKQQWQNKIALQAVSLVSLDYYQTDAGVALVKQVKVSEGILGGVAYLKPGIDEQIANIFELAEANKLDLDFHVDENGDPNSICLQKIAAAALKYKFSGKIVCGHCCSLATQPTEVVDQTIDLVKRANIAIISLPMCNLYLQDRQQHKSPYWRGITKVHELKNQGIPVMFASDNTRDPFYGFGDLDMLEVWNQSVRIAHLDTPYDDWINSVSKTPAQVMGLTNNKGFVPEIVADLIIFSGRYYSELLSRSQHNRIVVRRGQAIKINLPDYAESVSYTHLTLPTTPYV